MEKKKIIKILLLSLIILIMGTELYVIFNKDKNTNENVSITENKTNKNENKVEEKENKKYLADITTGYKTNGLKINEIKESEQVTYSLVSGLKDKNIEEKINNSIKQKLKEIKDKGTNNKKINGSIEGNFSNTISVLFEIIDTAYTTPVKNITLNIDLNTGKEIEFDDVILRKENLKPIILSKSQEDFSKYIGFLCNGGPCENPNPDYGVIEDQQLQIMNKYNKDDFKLYYTPTDLYLLFENVSISDPEAFFSDSKDCEMVEMGYGEEVCVKHYVYDTYILDIPFYKIYTDVIIYDRFETESSIFESDRSTMSRKFISEEEDTSIFIENTDSFIDYNFDKYSEIDKNEIKNRVIKESSHLNKDGFNLYNISGNIYTFDVYTNELDETYGNDKIKNYEYVEYHVNHYVLDKNIFEKNKEGIYLNKYEKCHYNLDEYECSYGYDFLKDYLNKKAFYYYIYDTNGNKVETKDIFSDTFDFSTIIPNEWLTLGKYKTIDEMLDNALIITDEDYSYPNYLVFYDIYDKIIIKYKGKSVTLANDFKERNELSKKIYK